MSADLVPGCILRLAFASMMLCSIVDSMLVPLNEGDLGPICISVGGGGLGSLGELGGRDMSAVLYSIARKLRKKSGQLQLVCKGPNRLYR